jgi:hypothetical protein
MESQLMTDVQSKPSTTVVFCIESGYFESQTLLAIESLRRFGGSMANAPVLAITPRFGPSLTRQTLQRLDELEVTYIRRDLRHSLSWYGFMNKPIAVLLAEEYTSTEQLIWLDSDVLIAAEPELLWLEPDIDFAACPTDKNVGTSGPHDKNEPYWVALSEYMNLNIDQLPWVVTEWKQERVRFSFNAGIFAFRRNTGLPKAYVEACEKLVNSRIAYRGLGIGNNEQPALGFAVICSDLRWRMLPESHNYNLSPEPQGMYRREALHSAKILHYHKGLTQTQYTWTLAEIEATRPDLYNWLKDRLPLSTKVGGLHRMLFRRVLREWRERKRIRIEATCQWF